MGQKSSTQAQTSTTPTINIDMPGEHTLGHNQKFALQNGVGAGVVRTKILLLGMRRAGKTSILNVLFNRLPPKQTFYLETTIRITKHVFDTVIPLEIWDCPGNITVEDLGVPLSDFSSLIFVIDIRDHYQQPISKLADFIIAAYHENPEINLEVFVHKAEKMQEEDKIENFRQIHERVNDRLTDESPDYELMPLNFHLTSVYDHSLHEAMSRVLHKLIDSLPYLENLLDVFCANSSSPKAFLFDTTSRLYVSTDSSPVDSLTHNLACDYLQMLNSFGSLYQSKSSTAASRLKPPTPPPTRTATSSRLPTPMGSPSHQSSALPPSPQLVHYDNNTWRREAPLSPTSPLSPSPDESLTESDLTTIDQPPFYPSASCSLSPSHPGTTLTYHVITGSLALLALVPTAVYEMRRGLVEYNVVWFREGVQEICAVEIEGRGG